MAVLLTMATTYYGCTTNYGRLYLAAQDPTSCGEVSEGTLVAGLREVVQAALPWDSFVHDLANVDAVGRVRYQTFLARYRVDSTDAAWQSRVLASLYEKLCEKDLSGTLAFFDTNLDGKVTMAELTQARARSTRAPRGPAPPLTGPPRPSLARAAPHWPEPPLTGPSRPLTALARPSRPTRVRPGRCCSTAASGYRRSSPRASPHNCYRARPRSRRRRCSTTSRSSSRSPPNPSTGHGRRLRGLRRCSTRCAPPASCPRLATALPPSLSPRDLVSVATAWLPPRTVLAVRLVLPLYSCARTHRQLQICFRSTTLPRASPLPPCR